MNKTWIALQLESADFPSYSYSKDKEKTVKVTSKDQADSILNRFKTSKKT